MILVVAEHSSGKLRKSTLEAVEAARSVASTLDTDLAGVVIGSDVAAVAEELARYLPRVLTVDGEQFGEVRAQPWTAAIASAARALSARLVVLSATRTGLSVGPRVAVRLGAGLLEDVTSLAAEDGAFVADRLTYLSRVVERVRARGETVVASVKPNVFPLPEPGEAGAVEEHQVELDAGETGVRVGERSKPEGKRIPLDEARVIVAGGRGVGGAEGFSELVEPLAAALGGAVASTRAVVDAGWRPYEEQVGQTGKSVAPDLYFALGISGAVQHLSGMNRSKVVVAINRDGDAPIFKAADYGIVGDVRKVVPEVVRILEEEGA